MPERGIMGMTLAARAAELASVIASARATDRAGKTLDTELAIVLILNILRDPRVRGGSLYLAGNGGSAAIASHSATDFVNAAQIRAITLHE